MSYDDIKEATIPKEFKQLTCQAKGCEYNLYPSCSHDWMELNERGECIFNTIGTAKHPNLKGGFIRIKFVRIIDGNNEWDDIPFEEFRKEILMGRPKKSDPTGGRSSLRHSDKRSSGPSVPDRFKSKNVYPDRKDRKIKNNQEIKSD